MLSPYALSFGNMTKSSEKLIPNLYPKTKYVVHYKNLKYYLEKGLVLTKVHRVLAFDQEAWLKPYITKNTVSRTLAKDDFEKDLYKLMNNAIYGKSMENKRLRVDIKLVTDAHKIRKLVAKPICQFWERINDELVMVNMGRRTVYLDRPIYAGFSILDISKLHMYRFHYDTMLRQYTEKRATLLFTDTDSLCYHVETQDIYQDMHRNLDLFDTSNYPKSHALYWPTNAKVLGKFKDETAGRPPREFVGLRAQMCSLLVASDDTPKLTAKGVKRSWVDKHVRHDNFLHVLENKSVSYARYYKFTSRRQNLATELVNKKCLDAFDDKRYILEDGVRSYSYGHKSIPPSKRQGRMYPLP